MPKLYGTAEDAEEIAQRLIPMYHPELATARIQYICVDKASQKNGRPVWGKAKKISGALEFLLEKDFMIEVALDCWNEASNRQREALVDHLLECCTGIEDDKTGEMKWTMRTADVQEFTSILHRHGAWHETLEGMVEVAQRLNIEARVQEVEDNEVVQGEV
jgi:hypothetical protein